MFKIPPYGAYCKNCIVDKKKCKGCIETNGKPFYIRKIEICPIFKWAMKKKVNHCGVCKKFPCKLFLTLYDLKRSFSLS